MGQRRRLCHVLSWPVAGGVPALGPPMPEGAVAGGTWEPGPGLALELRPGSRASRPPAVSRLGDRSAVGRVGFHDSKLAKPRRRLARVRADATTCRLQFRVMLRE